MSCHDLAYDKPHPSLISMCVSTDSDLTFQALIKVFDPEKAINDHKGIVLDQTELKRVAYYICHPYDPPTVTK